MTFQTHASRTRLHAAPARTGRPAAAVAGDLAALLDALRYDVEAARSAAPWPPVDVSRTPETLVLRAELPGLEVGDFEVLVEDDVLTLRGRRGPQRRAPREGFGFARRFRLPFEIDAADVRGRYRNGVLTLTLPCPDGSPTGVRTVPVGVG
jgi:HSP20 family protein